MSVCGRLTTGVGVGRLPDCGLLLNCGIVGDSGLLFDVGGSGVYGSLFKMV
jgi:hypothetical protein